MRNQVPRAKGKFWPEVREMIWLKAQQLFQEEDAKTMGDDFNGVPAEHSDLRGYFRVAKLIVLHDLYLQKKGQAPIEDDE